MEHEKMKRTAENLDKLAKFVAGFLVAFAIVFLILAVLVLIFGTKMFEPGSLTLDLDFVKLHLAEGCPVVTGRLQAHAVVGLVIAAALCIAGRIALGYLRRIFAPMKQGRAFAPTASEDLKKIAWIVLAGGVLVQATSVVERILVSNAYPMEAIFSSAAIAKTEYVQIVDFGFVLVFAAIMLLSYIFAYGQKLQQESDETL